MRIISGRRFEDIEHKEIEKADLITDLTGVLSYTSRLDVTLEKYFALLEQDGSLFVHTPCFTTVIENKDGTNLLLPLWLRTIEGCEIKELGNLDTFELKLFKSSREVKVPRLKLVRAFHAFFVFRVFREI